MFKNDLEMFFSALAMHWKRFTKLAYKNLIHAELYFEGCFILGVTNNINFWLTQKTFEVL